MTTYPLSRGRWRHYATLRANGHECTVTCRLPTDDCQVTAYVVTLNGSPRRVLADWREALAYASNLLTMRVPTSLS